MSIKHTDHELNGFLLWCGWESVAWLTGTSTFTPLMFFIMPSFSFLHHGSVYTCLHSKSCKFCDSCVLLEPTCSVQRRRVTLLQTRADTESASRVCCYADCMLNMLTLWFGQTQVTSAGVCYCLYDVLQIIVRTQEMFHSDWEKLQTGFPGLSIHQHNYNNNTTSCLET